MVSTSAAVDTDVLRKARGAFFTPEPLARYITDWAIRTPTDRVLEPSCGEAAFLLAAVKRMAALRAGQPGHIPAPILDGVELHPESAQAAQSLLVRAGVDARVVCADFFTVAPRQEYDAVVGNPPYIRYQEFTGEARRRSRAAAFEAGVPLTGLASSWAAFTVHSSLFLKAGGRIGLVLPAELMTVNYAAEVRRFLMSRFRTVRLVLFTERVFPGVLEEVVLLLAEGYDPEGKVGTDQCELIQVQNAESLSSSAVARIWKPESVEGKWTPSLLSAEALSAYSGLTGGSDFTVLEQWGDTTLGMVTGNNKFFALSGTRVAELGLQATDLISLSPPGSSHLRGLTLTDSALKELQRNGAPTFLFRPAAEPSEAGWRYIEHGEQLNVQTAYKCRVRKPWWRVPMVPPADLLLTYMNADTPRLCTNRARTHNLNSVHGVYLKPSLKRLGMDLLPLAALNSLTLVGAETVGRAYGGGMLKLEPREADRLPVPSPSLVTSARKSLSEIRPQMATHLRGGRLTEAAKLVDDVLLVGTLGVSRSDVKALRAAHAELTARRTARGGGVGRGKN
ncbi:class I SAM-dependent DNA methyltransferase [Actinoplanes sp. NPDC049265]|uniref:HsdM family class I SAM-dependent methyltransferase n=1 Tax=Actinoplanes sp. NPDC049265 TaxID=3363902 RepID=UPI0037183CCD